VAALGQAAKTSPPGTESIGKMIDAAGGSVLVLFDEVLNFLNRHRDMAESFHAFIQNMTVAMTGTTRSAAVISLPRSKVEMGDWDWEWQERITKVVLRRVAKDLIANDETEISEVIRRRLFEDLGAEKARMEVAKEYTNWCFERRNQLPAEWMSTSASETRLREFLVSKFETCYPFHPATLSVFQRKWQTLTQYQQTRGTLAMLAQWVALAYQKDHKHARPEPLITLGSAPLDVSEFLSVVLGQLGDNKLSPAIEADISGQHSHACALDADTKGPLQGIHRRVGAAILFESSGGQREKVAHLPELRFAIGGPSVDTTSVDNAAITLENKAYYIRKVSSDGFQIRQQATLKKVVNDRKASLDTETDVKPAVRSLVQKIFEKGASVPLVVYPTDSTDIQDSPRLVIVLADPDSEWSSGGAVRKRIAEWTRQRGKSPRLYPGSPVWCVKKRGRELREKVEWWLAWRRVAQEARDGSLGQEYEKIDDKRVETHLKSAEDEAHQQVWSDYRFIAVADPAEPDGIRELDIGAGHAHGQDTMCGRVLQTLKSHSLLSESVSPTTLTNSWPPAFKESGAWPLTSLRQSFLNGALTRLLDPDTVLRTKIADFVLRGEFGLASSPNPDATYAQVRFLELIPPDEIAFQEGVFLLTKAKAQSLKAPAKPGPEPAPVEPKPTPGGPTPEPSPRPAPLPGPQTKTIRVSGSLPPEVWNRFGTKVIPKLKTGTDVKTTVSFSMTIDLSQAPTVEADLRQILGDLGLSGKVKIE